MTLTAIVAATPTGIIGKDGDMPWRLSSDLKRFKRLTMGCPIIMGRKTFDSIIKSIGKPLPGRRTFVLTRDADWASEGVEVFNSHDDALAAASGHPSFVVGGAQIYQSMLPFCNRLFLTRVWSQTSGDTRVELPLDGWRCSFVERITIGKRDSVPTEFCVYERV